MPPNSTIDAGSRIHHSVIFANHFNRITQVKLRVFILKVANRGPHLTFLET